MAATLWAVALLAALSAAQPPGQPVVSWFTPAYNYTGDDGSAQPPAISNKTQPLNVFSSPGKASTLYVLGAYTSESPALAPGVNPKIDIVGEPLYYMWTSTDAGRTWAAKPVPPTAVRVRATYAALRTPSGPTQLCVIGGKTRSGSRWENTVSTLCSDDEGDTWLERAALRRFILSASIVQGRFGTYLIGGMTSLGGSRLRTLGVGATFGKGTGSAFGIGEEATWDMSSWSGVVRAVWDGTGRTILNWALVTSNTPMKTRLYPAVAYSYEQDALYLTGGYIPSAVQGSDLLEPACIVWKIDPKSIANESGWTPLARLPFVSNDALGVEPESRLIEVVINRPNTLGWMPHPGEGMNYTDLRRTELAGGLTTFLDPALMFLTAGRVYGSLTFGEYGWLLLQAVAHPKPRVMYEGPFTVRLPSVVSLVVPGKSPNGTISFVGIGLATATTRDAFVGVLVQAWPFVRCGNPCPPIVGEGGVLVHSTGCVASPYDSKCLQCGDRESTACEDGVTRLTRDCGRWSDTIGHPQKALCTPCTPCESGYYAAASCSGRNDTECSIRPWSPVPVMIAPKVATTEQVSTVVAVCLVANGLVLLGAAVVRAFGSRRVRRAVTGRCATRTLCPLGLQPPPAPSKHVQDVSVFAASVSLSLLMLVLEAILGVELLMSEDRMGVGYGVGLGVLSLGKVAVHGAAVLLSLHRVCSSRQTLLSADGATALDSVFKQLGAALHPRTLLLLLLAKARRRTVLRLADGTLDPAGRVSTWAGTGLKSAKMGPARRASDAQAAATVVDCVTPALLHDIARAATWCSLWLVLSCFTSFALLTGLFLVMEVTLRTPASEVQDPSLHLDMQRTALTAGAAATLACLSLLFSLSVVGLAKARTAGLKLGSAGPSAPGFETLSTAEGGPGGRNVGAGPAQGGAGAAAHATIVSSPLASLDRSTSSSRADRLALLVSQGAVARQQAQLTVPSSLSLPDVEGTVTAGAGAVPAPGSSAGYAMLLPAYMQQGVPTDYIGVSYAVGAGGYSSAVPHHFGWLNGNGQWAQPYPGQHVNQGPPHAYDSSCLPPLAHVGYQLGRERDGFLSTSVSIADEGREEYGARPVPPEDSDSAAEGAHARTTGLGPKGSEAAAGEEGEDGDRAGEGEGQGEDTNFRDVRLLASVIRTQLDAACDANPDLRESTEMRQALGQLAALLQADRAGGDSGGSQGSPSGSELVGENGAALRPCGNVEAAGGHNPVPRQQLRGDGDERVDPLAGGCVA